MKHPLAIIAIIATGALAGCGNMEPQSGENYGNLLSTSSGLTLTQAEHQSGWGESNCALCHNFNNIHLEDRTGASINMAAIRQTTFTQGNSSCATCHGTNGVP